MKQKYLVVEGLVLNVENARIVQTFVGIIDFDWNNLIVDCVALSYQELIPGIDGVNRVLL